MLLRSRETHILILATGVAALTCAATRIGGQTRERARIDVESLFTPSGWMGDGEYGKKYIEFSGVDRSAPHSPPSSIRVTYTFGPNRWAGIYWLNEPDNWGDKPGTNLSGRGFSKLTFWAKGEIGNETIEFKAGGIDRPGKKYRDSFVVTLGRKSLTRDWKPYQMDLGSASLGSVIGAFCWVASADYSDDKRVTFYLDDIILE